MCAKGARDALGCAYMRPDRARGNCQGVLSVEEERDVSMMGGEARRVDWD